jgi:hypothetical protein
MPEWTERDGKHVREYSSGSEYTVKLGGGFLHLESPHLDGRLMLSLHEIDNLAESIGEEKDGYYRICLGDTEDALSGGESDA